MRIWTIHPKHLDRQGLIALWREGLLAQKVLRGRTRGYRNHPQLERFKKHPEPVAAMATYLAAVCEEAGERGYNFKKGKISRKRTRTRIPETGGQLSFEWQHLKRKIKERHGAVPRREAGHGKPSAHPLFRIVKGRRASWEKTKPRGRNK